MFYCAKRDYSGICRANILIGRKPCVRLGWCLPTDYSYGNRAHASIREKPWITSVLEFWQLTRIVWFFWWFPNPDLKWDGSNTISLGFFLLQPEHLTSGYQRFSRRNIKVQKLLKVCGSQSMAGWRRKTWAI